MNISIDNICVKQCKLSHVFLALLLFMSISITSYGKSEENCAVCFIYKTQKNICYVNRKGKNDDHELGHILTACSIDPCLRARFIASKKEARKRKVPIVDVSKMSDVQCD